MPNFSYTAKSLKGKEQSGSLEAKNIQQLIKILKIQGLILIKAEPEKEARKKKKIEISISFLDRVSLTDKLMFTRNLQVMVSAGLSLPRSLETLSLQAKSKKFKSAILGMREDVVKGKNFSESMGLYPSIFSDLFQNMIKVGEETGNLEEVLKILAQQIEREHELKSRITGALMYPAVVITAMIGVGILMLIMVVPNLAATFEDLGVELPITTQIIIGIGTFFSEKIYLLLVGTVLLFISFYFGSKNKKGKKMIDTVLLKLPLISPLIKKTNVAHTIRTLSSLIASGVPIVKSLEIVSGTLGNVFYKQALAEAAEKVRKGEKLSESLKPYSAIYSPIVLQMIQVGEETGETSGILAKLAEFFEEEVANATKNLASIIEPILMLIIGAVIGFFAISMVQPMYSMLGTV